MDKELSRQPIYSEVRVFTRSTGSVNCKELADLPKISFALGSTDNEEDLRKALKGIDSVFCNLNSWILGIKGEIYWGIRIYELCVQSGVKHFIWSSLDNFQNDVDYDETLRVGHYEAKGYVEQWLRSVPLRKNSTRWSILTTGPYIDMLWELFCPRRDPDGTYVFSMPLDDGAIPFVALDDLGQYVHWILEDIDRSAGMNVKVAIAHVPLKDIPAAFTMVTGKPARAENPGYEEYFATGGFAAVADKKLGYEPAGFTDNTLLTYRQNFTNWFNLYRRCVDNRGVLVRDYGLLDKILPDRINSVQSWMRKVGYTGEHKDVLKSNIDSH